VRCSGYIGSQAGDDPHGISANVVQCCGNWREARAQLPTRKIEFAPVSLAPPPVPTHACDIQLQMPAWRYPDDDHLAGVGPADFADWMRELPR